jgi:hypothetical protein
MPRPRSEQISIADTPTTMSFHAAYGAHSCAAKIGLPGAVTNTGVAGLKSGFAYWPLCFRWM